MGLFVLAPPAFANQKGGAPGPPLPPGRHTDPFLPPGPLPAAFLCGLRPCLSLLWPDLPWSAPQQLLPKNPNQFTPQSLFLKLPFPWFSLLHLLQTPAD
jgi:hypothetical protein